MVIYNNADKSYDTNLMLSVPYDDCITIAFELVQPG